MEARGSANVAEVSVSRLTPELLDDFLRFFDAEAFTDNPEWAGCYCYFYLYPGTWEEWSARRGEENRAAVSELIRAGRMHGYLAYEDGRVVGWCHAARRSEVPNVERLVPPAEDPERIGAVVCFVVRPENRRKGIARRLLEAACAGFRADGLAVAEAYPAKDAATEAEHYHGPLDLYLAAGFTVTGETERFHLVRRKL